MRKRIYTHQLAINVSDEMYNRGRDATTKQQITAADFVWDALELKLLADEYEWSDEPIIKK